LGHFVGLFCFVLFSFGLLFLGFFPLSWDNDRTTSETPSPGLEGEGLTPKLLRLKLYCIWTWRFFFHLFIFYFFQSSLCLFNACSAYCSLVHYLSLFISLKLFCLFHFLLVCFFFPLSLTSLFSISSHPSILNITIVIITARKYLIAHSTGTITTQRAMTGRQKKQRSQFGHSKKLV
jgi:hypothetical protein